MHILGKNSGTAGSESVNWIGISCFTAAEMWEAF